MDRAPSVDAPHGECVRARQAFDDTGLLQQRAFHRQTHTARLEQIDDVDATVPRANDEHALIRVQAFDPLVAVQRADGLPLAQVPVVDDAVAGTRGEQIGPRRAVIEEFDAADGLLVAV